MAQTPHQPFEMNTGDVGGFADEREKRADLSSWAWRPLERPLVTPSERAEELPRNLADRPRLRMLHLRCQNFGLPCQCVRSPSPIPTERPSRTFIRTST